jgi:uncharacterized membrane protein YraQ (UPF0718 family)
VAVSLRKKGASPSATLAFWLGNPTLNPAVLVFMVLALSWQWALLRLVMGLVLVFAVPLLVARVMPAWQRPMADEADDGPAGAGAADDQEPADTAGRAHWAVRWLRSLTKLCISLIPEYVVVMLALGAARAWLFPAVGPELGNSILVIAGLAVAGALFAIPTAGEIPIIQTMRSFGMGAGPAGALLMTLAPISLPSLLMISGVYPRRVLVLVTLATVAIGILTGLLAIALGL